MTMMMMLTNGTSFCQMIFFDDYIKIAANFGFYVNKHVPWAIVANMNSKRMKNYMIRYGITSDVENFSSNFLQAEFISFESFKKYMFLAYSSFISYRPRTEKIIYKNCIKDTVSDSSFKTEREIYFRPLELNYLAPDYNQFSDLYSDVFFLEIYVNIRLKEEKIILDQRQHDILMLKLFKTKGDIYNKIITLSNFIALKRKNKFNKLTRKTKSVSMGQQYTTPSSYFNGNGGVTPFASGPSGGTGGSSASGY